MKRSGKHIFPHRFLLLGTLSILYFAIGRYISLHSRDGFWGTGAIDIISQKLQNELPGLRGFSARNLKNMRTFYEEWSFLEGNPAVLTAELERFSCRGFLSDWFYASLPYSHQGKIFGRTLILYPVGSSQLSES